MALRRGFLGHLARWSKGLGRDPEAFEEAVPYLASSVSVSGVWAETGLWAGKKWNVGRVWYGGKKAFSSAGCAWAGAGLSPLPGLQRERSGVLEQKGVLCFIHRPGRGLELAGPQQGRKRQDFGFC